MKIEMEYKITLTASELTKILRVFQAIGCYELHDDENLTEEDVDFFETFKSELEEIDRGF